MATTQTLSATSCVNPDGTPAAYKPVIVDPLSVTPTKDNVSCYWNPNQTGALSFGNLRFMQGTEVDDLASDVGLTCKLQTDRKIVISSGPMVNMFAVSKGGPIFLNFNDLQMSSVRSSPRSVATIAFVKRMYDLCAGFVKEKFGYSEEQGIKYVTPASEKFNQPEMLKVKVKNEGLKLVKCVFRDADGEVIAGDGDLQKLLAKEIVRGAAFILVLAINTIWVSKSKKEWGMVVQLVEAQSCGKMIERDQWVLDPSRLTASNLHKAEIGDAFTNYFATHGASKAMLEEGKLSRPALRRQNATVVPMKRRQTIMLDTNLEKDNEVHKEDDEFVVVPKVGLKATKAMKRIMSGGKGKGKQVAWNSDGEEEEEDTKVVKKARKANGSLLGSEEDA